MMKKIFLSFRNIEQNFGLPVVLLKDDTKWRQKKTTLVFIQRVTEMHIIMRERIQLVQS